MKIDLKLTNYTKIKYYLRSGSLKITEYLIYRLKLAYNYKKTDFKSYKNCEGLNQYNFQIPRFVEARGISAFLRVKNEERKISLCLNSIIKVFDEIVVIDNQSNDNTPNIVQEFQENHPLGHKIKLIKYPFSVSKCGKEHNNTPENSVHNLAYFYNYSLSHCTLRFVCKWDADMILIPQESSNFTNFIESINVAYPTTWNLTGRTVYKDLKNQYWLSKEEIHSEPRVFPLSYFHCYQKGDNFEKLKSPSLNVKISLFSANQPLLSRRGFSHNLFYELKSLDEDEFSHWSDHNFSTPRKKKEWETFQKIKSLNFKGSKYLQLLKVDFLDD